MQIPSPISVLSRLQSVEWKVSEGAMKESTTATRAMTVDRVQ